LRFIASPVSPSSEGGGEKPGGGEPAGGANGGTGGDKPGGGNPGHRGQEPMVPVQSRHLLTFAPLRVHASARGTHRADVYELISTHPLPGTLKLGYHCRPCLFLTRPLRLHSGSTVPYTHRSRRAGEIDALFGNPFYRGSNIEVTVSAPGMQPRHYDYRFPGARKVTRRG
jgi:hypothetical protein